MFRGRFEHTIDDKGRLSVPSKFRDVLVSKFDERLVVTNFDNCLWVYPATEWAKIEEKIAAMPQMSDVVKMFQRVFISGAVECAIDKSGRILLPPTLRDYAGITKDVVMVGMVNRIEIWAKDRWNGVFESALTSITSMGDKLAELGL